MQFVVNNIFENEIKESTTKENILKMMPEIYEKADSKEIIRLLPYKAYMALEDLMEYIKTRGLKYKNFKEQEILNREKYLWDTSTKKLYEYIKSKSENVWKYPFQRIIKEQHHFECAIFLIFISNSNPIG